MTEEAPTTQQRNATMARRYADGETLVAIAKDYGLTRERIRQIVQKVAGEGAAANSRSVREVRKTIQVLKTLAEIKAEYGDFAKMAASDGMTVEETLNLILDVDPTVDERQVHRYLTDSGFSFNKIHSGYAFPTELVHLGMWYLLAKKYGVTAAPKDRPSNQDLATLRLRTGLGETNASNRQVMEIVAIVEAVKEYAKNNPTIMITAQQYTDLRKVVEADLKITSIRNSLAWPADKQTVGKRFQGWSNAVKSIGLIPSERGRPKGLVKFTEAEYVKALTDFVKWATISGLNPTADRYTKWVVTEKKLRRIRPSTASIRNVHGTWNNAMRSIQDVGLAA